MPNYISKGGKWYPAKEKVALKNYSEKAIENPSTDEKLKGEEIKPGEDYIYSGPDRAALFNLWTDKVETLGQDFRQDPEFLQAVRNMGYSSYKKYVVFTICLVFILVFLIGIFPHILSSTRRILEGPKLVFSFITNVGPQLEQERGRTNILLLGKGGGTHPGASLTDSIIFMSVNNSTGDTVMISLPRDIWVEELERPEDNKLNRMYEIGEGMKKGGGLLLSKAIVSHLIGQPIHYAVLIDFEGFKKAIDILGGIDIEVERRKLR